MVRPKHLHSPTRERLLDAAQRLMLEQGYAATSVEEVCRAAKLTKGSFFHYFRSKDHLGRELLRRFCADGERRHRAFCGNASDPLARVYADLDQTARMFLDPATKGCLLGCFSQELCESNSRMREACAEGFEGWSRQFGAELARAKAQYAPKAAFEPLELAHQFIAIVEGSLILGKALRSRRVGAANVRHFKAYLKSLFGR